MYSTFLPQKTPTSGRKKIVKQLNVIWDHTEGIPSFSNISVLFQKEFKYAVILLIDFFFFFYFQYWHCNTIVNRIVYSSVHLTGDSNFAIGYTALSKGEIHLSAVGDRRHNKFILRQHPDKTVLSLNPCLY